ncbi:hypothetical protein AG37_18315 [Salmonella enterica subsp. enterica]|nr:hypothetical protein [Salmonella enterica]ECI4636802.1 hypothetical protein [Salmonella enterica subsp. enterica]PUU38545.1 hypothetical protein BUJ25_012030 [Salmonella enterica subsp. enterica serovar Newport]EBK7845834.1 hypothetical protein [Salmonella enterica]EBK9182805.1 hypothetical protein [Salmonella enterica]
MFEFILLVLLTISNVATYILVMIFFIFAFLFFTVEGWMILLCILILSSIFGKDDEKKRNK